MSLQALPWNRIGITNPQTSLLKNYCTCACQTQHSISIVTVWLPVWLSTHSLHAQSPQGLRGCVRHKHELWNSKADKKNHTSYPHKKTMKMNPSVHKLKQNVQANPVWSKAPSRTASTIRRVMATRTPPHPAKKHRDNKAQNERPPLRISRLNKPFLNLVPSKK